MTKARLSSTLRPCRPAATSLGLLSAVALASSAGAQTCPGAATARISQLTDYVNGFRSDTSPQPQIVADQLVLAEDTLLSSVTIWGAFANSNVTNNFTLIVHADSGAAPGPVLYMEQGMVAALVNMGTLPPPFIPADEYQATLTPAAQVVLPAGVVWLEIYNEAGGNDPWFWLTGTLDPTSGVAGSKIAFTAPGGPWSDLGADMAMVVCGEPTDLGAPDPMCIALPNSTGSPAALHLAGSGSAGAVVSATVAQGPSGQFGYVISGPNPGLYTPPPGSQGIICIGNPQYRYNSVTLGQLFRFDAGGVSQAVTGGGPSQLPTDGSFGPVPAVVVGESRAFQAWYRDSNPGTTNNFSESKIVTFN